MDKGSYVIELADGHGGTRVVNQAELQVYPLMCFTRLLVRHGDCGFLGGHSDQNPLMTAATLGLPLR